MAKLKRLFAARRIGAPKTLPAEANIIGQLAGELLLEPIGILARNAVFAGAPARRWTLARQHLRANTQSDEIGAQAALPRSAPAPCNPFLDAGYAETAEGKCQIFRGVVEMDWPFVKIGIHR